MFTQHLCIRFTSGTQASEQERALLKKLFHSNYDKNERPVVNDSDTVTVVFGLTLNQIVDVVRIIFSFFIVFCITSVHRLYPKDCLKKKKNKKKTLYSGIREVSITFPVSGCLWFNGRLSPEMGNKTRTRDLTCKLNKRRQEVL